MKLLLWCRRRIDINWLLSDGLCWPRKDLVVGCLRACSALCPISRSTRSSPRSLGWTSGVCCRAGSRPGNDSSPGALWLERYDSSLDRYGWRGKSILDHYGSEAWEVRLSWNGSWASGLRLERCGSEALISCERYCWRGSELRGLIWQFRDRTHGCSWFMVLWVAATSCLTKEIFVNPT